MRWQIKEMQRTVSDRMIVTDPGVPEQINTTMAIYAQPANVFVAAFISLLTINFIQAMLDDGGMRLAGSDTLHVLSDSLTRNPGGG